MTHKIWGWLFWLWYVIMQNTLHKDLPSDLMIESAVSFPQREAPANPACTPWWRGSSRARWAIFQVTSRVLWMIIIYRSHIVSALVAAQWRKYVCHPFGHLNGSWLRVIFHCKLRCFETPTRGEKCGHLARCVPAQEPHLRPSQCKHRRRQKKLNNKCGGFCAIKMGNAAV